MKFVNYKIIIAIILLFFLAFILKDTTQELFKIRESGTYISRLEHELENERNRNTFLNEQLKYVQTEEFIENESRKKLGLVKSGEVIVQKELGRTVEKEIDENLNKPNWQQWLELFM